jgi:hypothetical protein
MPPSNIHVEPNSKGRWIVRREDAREPLSEHGSATDAERVARALAQLEDASFVVLHDRYTRTRRVRIEGAAAAKPHTSSTQRLGPTSGVRHGTPARDA